MRTIPFEQDQMLRLEPVPMFEAFKKFFEDSAEAARSNRVALTDSKAKFCEMVGHALCLADGKLTKEHFEVLILLYDAFYPIEFQSTRLSMKLDFIAQKYGILQGE